MTHRHRALIGNQRGTSTLEFAVVLPVLLIVFLGGLELSRAWLTANVASNAVREGARTAVVTPAATAVSAGVTRINQVLSAAALNVVSGPTVTCSPSCAPDAQVTASVTVRFQTVVPLILPQLQQLDITETATMRYE